MSTIKFYNDMLSQPVRAVWIFMKMNDIPFESVTVSLLQGDHKKEDYIRKVPSHTVPAIEDDGFILSECQAILLYLCRKYPEKVAAHWYPKDVKTRAKVDQYMSWHHSNIRKDGVQYFVNKFFLPNIIKKSVDDAKIEEVTENLNRTLDFMEKHILKKDEFIVGNEVSLADLIAYCEVMQPIAGKCDVTNGRPKLKAWMERVKQRLSPTVVDAHKTILEKCEMI